jgi:dihydrolipoamide dehydrogenase
MVVGEVAEATDLLVIGGGPGGYTAALHAARLGTEVTLVERESVGGVCLNVGCIPSKVLIHAAGLAALGGTPHQGVHVRTEVHMDEVRASMDEVVAGLTSGVEGLLRAAGVTVVEGTARFSRPGRVAVVTGSDVRHLEFRRCVLAMGSRPATLDSLPLDDPRVVDSTGALALTTLPERVVVVTVVEAAARILPNMDAALARVVARRLRDLGVELVTGTAVSGLDDTGVRVEGRDAALPADVVVVAVGRVPNTDDTGLDVAGVTADSRGLIEVGPDRLATPTIAAIGDITPGPALAHKASAEAEVAVAALHGDAHAVFDPACIPEVVFSDPEVAQIGLTPDSAGEQGIAVSTFRFPHGAASRSRTIGDTAGFVELVADEAGTVLGGLLAGHGVSELVSEVGLAIELAATVEDVAATIRPHPTHSEAITEAALGLLGRPLHVHR